ncbi:MAG: hypothetical protein A2297_03180 [Elusimicrobia bacterium RIFOXYB2_FULL_48_7]|nr:MAG: hypothetical protein A2297_03180 [Elusimicrobia bacterium RIFOXYB2_FULL_48_7]
MITTLSVLAVILVILSLPAFFMIFHSRFIKKINSQNQEIIQTKEKLQSYLQRIDSLVLTLKKMHKFSVGATGMSSKEELSRFVLDSCCELFDSQSGSIMMLEPNSGTLKIIASRNVAAENSNAVENLELRLGEGVAGKVAQEGKPVFIEDIEKDPRFVHLPDIRYTSKSMLCAPIETKGKIAGVINIHPDAPPVINGKSAVFDDKNLHLLAILTDQVAVALENIELYNNLQKTYLEMVESLAKAIDAKDSYTHDHADRARGYAAAICRELGLPESITKHVEYAALIHDIGKIGIDNSVLEKSGKLSPEERKKIEQHPIIGAKIIEPFSVLAPIAPIIRHHHEYYNGMGYPAGLKGEEIPLGSRIVTIIDSFDAMTSDRPYRKAMSRIQAVQELKRSANSQFDPGVVEAFLRTLEHDSSQ